jgi:hypothetical protein
MRRMDFAGLVKTQAKKWALEIYFVPKILQMGRRKGWTPVSGSLHVLANAFACCGTQALPVLLQNLKTDSLQFWLF